ncbi:hypothetical protein VRK_17710 [Vibrio sp. MEBiC08052]|nr:hypothetical protein VRK_17710 [Vibrio sp. MEBiC08052]
MTDDRILIEIESLPTRCSSLPVVKSILPLFQWPVVFIQLVDLADLINT